MWPRSSWRWETTSVPTTSIRGVSWRPSCRRKRPSSPLRIARNSMPGCEPGSFLPAALSSAARISGVAPAASRPVRRLRVTNSPWWPGRLLASSCRTASTWDSRWCCCPAIEAGEGDELEITADQVRNHTTGQVFDQVKMPASRKGIMEAGGLIPYTRTLLMAGR